MVSGLRPKKKSTEIEAKATPAPLQISISQKGTACNNPLERLCELLLPWRLLDDLGKEKAVGEGGAVPFALSATSDLAEWAKAAAKIAAAAKEREQLQKLALLPSRFRFFEDYLAAWEMPVVDEIKAKAKH